MSNLISYLNLHHGNEYNIHAHTHRSFADMCLHKYTGTYSVIHIQTHITYLDLIIVSTRHKQRLVRMKVHTTNWTYRYYKRTFNQINIDNSL